MLLRPATLHDLPALHGIERSATELYYEAGFSPAQVDRTYSPCHVVTAAPA